ncbi:MAG: glutathione S-transferase [Parvularculaceae bacterium]
MLYTFRRCPYAMRARMAITASRVEVEQREVDLKAKPAAMLEASPKGTVPVLICKDGTVIDESLDIMLHVLRRHDSEGWLSRAPLDDQLALIACNDGPFKDNLDRYKYASRFEGEDSLFHRAEGVKFLETLNDRLGDGYLFGSKSALADIAIFPFVRQFRIADDIWFDALPFNHLKDWLLRLTQSDLFRGVMKKSAVR